MNSYARGRTPFRWKSVLSGLGRSGTAEAARQMENIEKGDGVSRQINGFSDATDKAVLVCSCELFTIRKGLT